MIRVLCMYLSVDVPSGHAVNCQMSVFDRHSSHRVPCHQAWAPRGDSVGQMEAKGKREREMKAGRGKKGLCLHPVTDCNHPSACVWTREQMQRRLGLHWTKLSLTLSAKCFARSSCQRSCFMCVPLYFYPCECCNTGALLKKSVHIYIYIWVE